MTTNIRPAILRRAAAVALAFVSLQSMGCFGRFALTRKVYELNESVDDKFLRSIVTFAMVVIPVYGVCAFADWALFNTIEFWGGKNPVDGLNSDLTRAKPAAPPLAARDGSVGAASPDGRVVPRPQPRFELQGDTLIVRGVDADGAPHELVMTLDAQGAVLREGGRLISRLRYDEAGNAQVLDAGGAIVSARTAGEIARLGGAAREGRLGEALEAELARLARR